MSARLRRVFAWLSLAGLASIAAGPLWPGPAEAVAPAKIGWWSELQQSEAVGNHQIPLGQLPGGTDLHVGNDPSGPDAISALTYPLLGGLPSGTDAGRVIAELRLQVSAPALGTPVVLACRILAPWVAGDGGDWNQRPAYLHGGCAEGQLSSDGKTIGFTLVAALASKTSIDLALVPALASQIPFQVQFSPPGADSLVTDVPPAPPPVRFVLPPIPAPAAQPMVAGAPAPAVSETVRAVVPPLIAAQRPTRSGTTATTRRSEIPLAPSINRPGRTLPILLLAISLATAGALWSPRGRALLGAPRPAATRGVGRLVRTRTTRPRLL